MMGPMRYAVMIAIVCAITAGSVYAVERRLDRADACDNGLVVPDPEANPGLVADCEALLAARDALRGGGRLDWSYSRPITQWQGLFLDGEPRRIVGLRLAAKNINGVLPPELGLLGRLRYLNLRSNLLTGPIPPELGQLAELEIVQLQWNLLGGLIPSALGRLESLRVLNLRDNELSGPIPATLGQLAELRELRLHENRLDGRIPRSLDDLPALELVRLDGNRFSGCMPPGLAEVADSDVDRLGLPPCPPR